MTGHTENTDLGKNTNMTETSEILRSMMVENTGCHFLDSGGSAQYDANGNYTGSTHGYGRNFERNKGRDFESERPVGVEFEICGDEVRVEFSHNTYHWLKERLEFDPEMDELFHGAYLKEVDEDDNSWLFLMEGFPAWLEKQQDDEENELYGSFGGIYGEGEPLTVNTYNHECLLDQTLQFTYFSGDRGEYVLLQIHGGADVRGGYTKPRVFSCGHHSELDIFDYARGELFCSGEDHHPTALGIKERQEKQVGLKGIDVPEIDFDSYNSHGFSTDDGYNWYSYNCNKKLSDYEAKNLEEDDVWEPGKLCVKGGVGYCPTCGAKLVG